MADEPSLTRWSFEDFKMFYDVKFGRKKAPEESDSAGNDHPAGVFSNGNSSYVTSHGSGQVKNISEVAINEQYRNQDSGNSEHCNRVLSNRFDENSYGFLICLNWFISCAMLMQVFLMDGYVFAAALVFSGKIKAR